MGSGSVSGPVRVAVCSGDQLRRDALAAYLGTLPDFALVGQAAGGTEIVPLAESTRPDIVLLDGGQHPGERLPALSLLRERLPGIAVVLGYDRLTPGELAAFRDAGLAALVPYAHGLGGLLSVLRALSGRSWLTMEGGPLTARQREVLLLLRSGHQVSEIARLLAISVGTVENHRRRVYAKLGAPPTPQARRATAGSRAEGERQPPSPVRPVLAVVVGDSGKLVDRVLTTLITHRLPVVREHGPETVAQVHWLRTHRGPVLRVLVNPTVDHLQAGAALGWIAVLVHDQPVDRGGIAEAVAHGVHGMVAAGDVEHQLVPVLNLVAAGYLVLDPSVSGFFTDTLTVRSARKVAPASPRAPAPAPREGRLGPLFRIRPVAFT